MSSISPLRIADREFASRLILGTGGFDNHELLAPVTAELVVGGLLGVQPPPEFSPARFAGVTVPC